METPERQIASDPQSTSAWGNLAYALYGLRRYDEVLEASQNIFELQPQSFAAWNAQGCAYHGLKRYADAMASFEQALMHATNDRSRAVAWGNLANTHAGLNQRDEAVILFTHALALDPTIALGWGN